MRYIMILVLIPFIFIGCYDKAYGPKIKNTYDEFLEIEVTYKNGSIDIGRLHPNSCTFIGKSDEKIDEIIKISFAINKKLDYVLNEDEIKKLKELTIKLDLSNPSWYIYKDSVIIKECTYK